jgi:hypothetical protein
MIPARPSRYERQASSEYPNKSEPEYAGFAPPYAQGAAENLDLASAKGHVLFDEQADLVDEMTVQAARSEATSMMITTARYDGLT